VAATHGPLPPIEDRWSALPIQQVGDDTLPARSAGGSRCMSSRVGVARRGDPTPSRDQPLDGLAGAEASVKTPDSSSSAPAPAGTPGPGRSHRLESSPRRGNCTVLFDSSRLYERSAGFAAGCSADHRACTRRVDQRWPGKSATAPVRVLAAPETIAILQRRHRRWDTVTSCRPRRATPADRAVGRRALGYLRGRPDTRYAWRLCGVGHARVRLDVARLTAGEAVGHGADVSPSTGRRGDARSSAISASIAPAVDAPGT
jgi:hypothetical protein